MFICIIMYTYSHTHCHMSVHEVVDDATATQNSATDRHAIYFCVFFIGLGVQKRKFHPRNWNFPKRLSFGELLWILNKCKHVTMFRVWGIAGMHVFVCMRVYFLCQLWILHAAFSRIPQLRMIDHIYLAKAAIQRAGQGERERRRVGEEEKPHISVVNSFQLGYLLPVWFRFIEIEIIIKYVVPRPKDGAEHKLLCRWLFFGRSERKRKPNWKWIFEETNST